MLGCLADPPSSAVLSTIVCVNISSTRCDFSRANISAYGLYTGGVKAALGEESSDWVKSNRVSPDMDSEDQPSAGHMTDPPPAASSCLLSPSAIIGPPNVTLLSGLTTIEVIIADPKFAVSTLKGVYSIPVYNITYWRDGQRDKVT